jgi:hypothetical protein
VQYFLTCYKATATNVTATNATATNANCYIQAVGLAITHQEVLVHGHMGLLSHQESGKEKESCTTYPITSSN